MNKEWTLIEAWKRVRTIVPTRFRFLPFLCNIINHELKREGVPEGLRNRMLERIDVQRQYMVAMGAKVGNECAQPYSDSVLWISEDKQSRIEFINRVIQELKEESHDKD